MTTCFFRSCSSDGDFSDYSLQNGSAPSTSQPALCSTRVCEASIDVQIYSLQDALFFNGAPLSFLIQCPTGQVCPPGTLPRVFTYPPGTFSFPQPPPGSVIPIVLQMTGCLSVVTRVLPFDASQVLINRVAQDIINEVAQQRAECDARDLLQQLPI